MDFEKVLHKTLGPKSDTFPIKILLPKKEQYQHHSYISHTCYNKGSSDHVKIYAKISVTYEAISTKKLKNQSKSYFMLENLTQVLYL